jgi:lysophospholipase L1-like esterase
MRFKFALLILILTLAAVPALAQQDSPNRVSFNGFSFSYDPALGSNVNIGQIPGDPVADAGPGFSDAAKTQFTLYNAGEPMDSLFDTGGVRVYRMADIAQYDFLQAVADQLEQLLADRPDLAQFVSGVNDTEMGGLPYMPLMTHGQTLTARAQYIETEAVQGVSYLTVFRADVGPFTNQDFLYTFQGITSDGAYFVTVTMPLLTELFPEPQGFDMAQFQATFETYLTESIATLDAAAPDAFMPALDALDALVQSIRVE